MNVQTRILALILCPLALAACGGGSSGSGLNSQPPAAVVNINAANAPEVAGAGATAALSSSEAASLGAPDGSITSAGQPPTKPALTQALKSVPIGPETTACLDGGTVTLSGDLANLTTLTAGDTLTFDFDACVQDGDTIDGTISMTIDAFEGDLVGGLYNLETSTTYSMLTVQSGNDSAGIDGDVSVDIDTRNSPTVVLGVSGQSLTLDVNTRSLTLSGFSTTTTLDESMFPVAYTVDSNGSVASTEFDGTVSYESVIPFAGSGDDYPSSGEFLVSSSDGSSVRLIVLDNVNVRLQVDSDGDDAVDDTIDTTWDELIQS